MSQRRRTYCCVPGCQQTRESNPDCSFYSLPTDADRLDEWLAIIRRPDLKDQPSSKLKNRFVCSSHFEDSDTNPGLRFLFPDAVPYLHLQGHTHASPSPPSHVDSSQNLQIVRTSVDWDDVILNTAQAASLEPPQKRRKVVENKAKETANVTLGAPMLEDDITKNIHKLMQNQRNRDKNSKEYILYALNMYLLNPQAYRFIRNALELPSEKVFKRMKMKLPPKLDSRVLDCLSSKLKSFPEKAKYCTVCVENLFVDSSLYYDILNDELVGLQDLDGIKSEESAGLAYVIMVRSILVKWDQPVAYSFLPGIKSFAQLESWIDGVISSLFDIGFEVMALVTNQRSNFQKYASDIKGLSPEEHFFTVDNKKVYYIFDVPQLLKSIRNNFGTKDIYYNNKKISWQFIELLFRLESKKKNKLIPKITNAHISPNNFLKMPSVRHAAEILSDTVAAAIHAYVDMKEMPEEARDTAHFCIFMNNLFDVLNSSTYRNDNIYKCALGSNEVQMEILREALNVFGNVESRKPDQAKERVNTLSTLPSIQMSLNSIIAISKDLDQLGHKRILTERLNLDPLENFIDLIRNSASKNPEPTKPTPIQFCRLFSKLFLKYIYLKSPLSNRPGAFQKYFEDATQLRINTTQPIPTRSLICLRGDTDYRIELPEDLAVDHATIYMASYIFYKCQQVHSCPLLDQYAASLPDLSKTKIYNKFNRNASFYGKLKLLQYPFIQYIEQLEIAFLQNFKKGICSNPGAQLFSSLRDIPFDQAHPCKCFPKIYLVKLLIRLRIYTTVKTFNKQVKQRNISISEFFFELNK